jgi:hypothetical protein
MSPNHPPHATAVERLDDVLHARAWWPRPRALSVADHAACSSTASQNLTSPWQHASGSRTSRQHPGGGDVLLVCEVADSSLTYDRKVKFDLYARAGIGEYWIINLSDQVLEVYRQPVVVGRRAAYQCAWNCCPTSALAPLAFPDVEIALREIFPEREAD